MKHLLLLLFLLASHALLSQSNYTDSTYLYIKSDAFISSRFTYQGAEHTFTVVEDVYQNGVLIIEQGSKVTGYVIYNQKAGLVGAPGQIEIKLNAVQGIKQDYDVGGPILYSRGRSRQLAACGLAFVSPFFLLIKGQEAAISPSVEVEIYLAPARDRRQSN